MDTSSRHKIGDIIAVNLFTCGVLHGGIISGVKYTDYGKVLYDVTFRPFTNEEDNENITTIFKDVDSYFIKTETDLILGE